ncbi:class F sortase [Candidatus Roizmanbacteria bacterium]|nr:class F sortase [Candidatus Roizmanbacteria bacterium]
MRNLILVVSILLGVLTGIVVSALVNPFLFRKASQLHQLIPAHQYALPARLLIPRLRIDSAVEAVAQDKDGAMDVPKNEWNVGWYSLGTRPGETGSAVIAGHLDTAVGPAIFYRISSLQPDDVVEVIDIKGRQTKFRVTSIKVHPYTSFPINEVFGKTGGSFLNLITCTGAFDQNTKRYSDRIVVYTQKMN